jgi:deoxyhypusine synthase
VGCDSMNEIKDLRATNQINGGYLDSLHSTGFQATSLAQARETLKEMIEEDYKILLSFTANMMATGLRGLFTELIKKDLIHTVITTGGSIDHDIIRAHTPYLLGSWDADDTQLHEKGVNRIGNILVPNTCYELLEEKVKPLLKKAGGEKECWTPSELIKFLADNMEDKNMFIQQCSQHNIPIFSPGFIDSAIGLQVFFHRQDHKEFKIDTAADLNNLEARVMCEEKLGGLVCGGGISKHHLLGSTLLRGGLDKAVYLTTASEFDGSLSGARPREAKSWGKINSKGDTVTIYGDASLTLPLLLHDII